MMKMNETILKEENKTLTDLVRSERAASNKLAQKLVAVQHELDDLEGFINRLPWSGEAGEHDKALVAGNLRNFAYRIKTAIEQVS